jgi:hypothetical protein
MEKTMPKNKDAEHAETPKASRKRRNLGRRTPAADRAPTVRELPDGSVAVGLDGRHGQGKFMLLDAADWDWIKPYQIGWLRAPLASGGFVSSGTVAAARLAASVGLAPQAPETHPNTTLARILARPGEGQVVWHIDHEPWNLVRGNLEVISKEECAERIGDMLRWLPTAKAILKEIGG